MTASVMRAAAVLVALALVSVTALGVAQLLGLATPRSSTPRLVLQILVLSAAWLLSNSPVEGRVLWTPSVRHGLTEGDLAAAPALLVAMLLVLARARG